MHRRAVGGAVVALIVLAACSHRAASSAPPPSSSPSTAVSTTNRAGLAVSQGCVGGASDSGAGVIAWRDLGNPILSYPAAGIRDPSIRLVHGTWHLFFTTVVGGAPQWALSNTASSDVRHWSGLGTWSQPGALGLASPDVTRRPDGTYVAVYQSDPGETSPPGQDKLYYRTSPDMRAWSPPRRLMPRVHAAASDRLIDAALAWTDHGLILGYKFGFKDGAQHFEIAWSRSGSLDGPWTLVGRPNINVYGDTIENYEFVRIDGGWDLLATSNTLDRPWLFALRGDPRNPNGWLRWSPGRELNVPREGWNSTTGTNSVDFEQANGAYLCDARRIDGHYYLFYFGTNELTTYGGWGHTSLGVARSTDLVTWEVPCGHGRVSTPAGCVAA